MKKKHIIALHAFYFFYVFGWDEVRRQLFKPEYVFSLQRLTNPFAISAYILFIGSFYVNYLFIMPAFFKKNAYIKFVASWLLLLAAFIIARHTIEEVWFFKWWGMRNYNAGTTLLAYTVDNFFECAGLIMMSTVFWTVTHYIQSEKDKAVLVQQKQQAELSFLRNQVNPHFIFNTMNNIYAMVYQKSAKALPAIEKLSNIMRYVMTESDVQQILLAKEVAYLQNFIELQMVRINIANSVRFNITGNIDNVQIAPLLLIPFVENGFKHGITNKEEYPFRINLTIENKTLLFTTSNYISKGHKDESNGIGLLNVQKRLALLYPGKHILEIKNSNNIFTTNLNIQL
jgi:two-component system LytT family sensor kinase